MRAGDARNAQERAEVAWRSPVVVWSQQTPEQRQVSALSWKRGDLGYKLTPAQLDLDHTVEAWIKRGDLEGEGRIFAIDCSRRLGKSAYLGKKGITFSIQRPASRTVWCFPQYEEAKKIVPALMSIMLDDCPPSSRPEWLKSEKKFRFPNGSVIEIVGMDVNPDAARGAAVDLVLLDEAGFFDNLEYLIHSVLYPQMLGRDHARIICASTPSKTPGHYWSSELVPQCVARGAHTLKTLLDADQYTDRAKREFIMACPSGSNADAKPWRGSTCLREYFCLHIIDSESAIIPEFADVREDVICEVPEPEWFDGYTVMDPGFNDLAAVLLSYWHFERQELVIIDEFARPRANSRKVADGIRKLEEEHWGKKVRRGANYLLRPQPYMRYSDNNPGLLADMHDEHGLTFAAVQKNSLDKMVDSVRVMMQEKKIRIHPRCVKLISHLDKGIWKRSKTARRPQFDRPGGDFGHYDLIAALVYTVLMVNQRRNPKPKQAEIVRGDMVVRAEPGKRSKWQGPSYWTGKAPGEPRKVSWKP